MTVHYSYYVDIVQFTKSNAVVTYEGINGQAYPSNGESNAVVTYEGINGQAYPSNGKSGNLGRY